MVIDFVFISTANYNRRQKDVHVSCLSVFFVYLLYLLLRFVYLGNYCLLEKSGHTQFSFCSLYRLFIALFRRPGELRHPIYRYLITIFFGSSLTSGEKGK